MKYSTVEWKHFLTVLLCFAKIVRKICVKKNSEFNGVYETNDEGASEL